MSTNRLSAFCAGLALVSGGGASAHHAFSANYDLENKGTIEGVVEEVYWANPHVHYYVSVTGEDGAKVLWDVETMNLSTMTKRGWTKSTLSVGDEVKVSGDLGRNGVHRIWMGEVERADGKPLPTGP